MDWTSIVVAVITALGALVGTYFANRKSASLLEYRMKELETKVNLHNSVIERTYKLETAVELLEAEDKRLNERIKIIEGKTE